jgi:hypothetical protein
LELDQGARKVGHWAAESSYVRDLSCHEPTPPL